MHAVAFHESRAPGYLFVSGQRSSAAVSCINTAGIIFHSQSIEALASNPVQIDVDITLR